MLRSSPAVRAASAKHGTRVLDGRRQSRCACDPDAAQVETTAVFEILALAQRAETDGVNGLFTAGC